jgi:hypothetical protein
MILVGIKFKNYSFCFLGYKTVLVTWRVKNYIFWGFGALFWVFRGSGTHFSSTLGPKNMMLGGFTGLYYSDLTGK